MGQAQRGVAADEGRLRLSDWVASQSPILCSVPVKKGGRKAEEGRMGRKAEGKSEQVVGWPRAF